MTTALSHAIDTAITDDDLIRYGRGIFVEWIGGEVVIEMMVKHGQGLGWSEIGRQHGVSHVTAASWVRTARRKMRSKGLTPPGEHEGLSPR